MTFAKHTNQLSKDGFVVTRNHHHPLAEEPTQDDKTTNGIHCFRLNGDDLRGNDDDHPMSSRGCCLYRHRSLDSSCFPSMNSVSRNASRKINQASSKSYDFMPTPSSLNRSESLKKPPHLPSGNANRRSNTPIMYSNSSGMLKPPPIEKKLQCTLEELCYGCKKKIMITRDVLTDTGGIVQEEELLTINVQPGWKKGTKITFEGKGNERLGAYREDIIFIISEKRHHLFRREGDDLELGVEIPLVKALTGCIILVPLLGGEHINLTLDNIICPGYEKIIPGQGMPISKEPGKRGNLKITFLVVFPTQLTGNQRSEAVRILQDS
ncbi:DnaJ-like subfamily B member 13 [Spatholobus suberectus]|nr:DnaJ-like subfamily B member 13 [Spatholobus suberectus]